jgi:mRNA interferase YafQ
MLKPAYTIQFQKDLKRIKKRGEKIKKLKFIIIQLVNQKPLDERYRDHKLIGTYKGRRECHIKPDWLLIYKIMEKDIIFERTGSHSDLFK